MLNSLIDRVGMAWAFRILGLSTWAVAIPAALVLKERMRRNPVTVEWFAKLFPYSTSSY